MPPPRKKPSWSPSMETQLRAEVVICPTLGVPGAAVAGATGGAAAGGAAGGAAAGGAAAGGAAGAGDAPGAQASSEATRIATSRVIVVRSPAMGLLLRAEPSAATGHTPPAQVDR